MCLNGLKCSQNAGKLHSESTKFQIFMEEHPPNPLVTLVQITHVKSWIHPCCVFGSEALTYIFLTSNNSNIIANLAETIRYI